ncbi:MAG: hypothetical protein JOZ22_19595 [Acidobacteriia bacterium]|nr:hypothetical protein [Terriglobia bacterium]
MTHCIPSHPDGLIPRRLPAAASDRLVYNLLGRSDENCTFVVEFSGCLSERRLQRVLRLVMDVEPVFGCRYVKSRMPYWERRDDLDRLELCDVSRSADIATELEHFVASGGTATKDPLLHARIVRGESDTLFLRTNHVAADAAGYKELLALIAVLYRDCAAREPEVRPNLGSREKWQLFRQVGWRQCLRILRKRLPRAANPEWRFPMAPERDRGPRRFSLRRLEPGALGVMRRFAKQSGATLNDIFIAACFRVLWRFLDFPCGIPQSIAVPADLRQYLSDGKAEAIGNFSIPFPVTLERVPGEPLHETLHRVHAATSVERRKEQVLASELISFVAHRFFPSRTEKAFAALERDNWREGRTTVGFTNNGILAPEQMDFGVPVTDAYRILFAPATPGLFWGVSSFQRRLTFALTYFAGAFRSEDVEAFLDTFIEELPTEEFAGDTGYTVAAAHSASRGQ